MDDEVDALVHPLLAGEYIQSAVVGIWRDGAEAFLGYPRAASREAIGRDRDTIFEIGSTTKIFTLVLLADMVRDGTIDLDSPVSDFVPEVPALREGQKRLMTIRHLATNRSGLKRDVRLVEATDPRRPFEGTTVARLYEFLRDDELDTEPGTQWCYSNLGFGLLGHILGRQSGLGYYEVLRARVLAPVGMADTGLAIPPNRRSRLAQGHTADGEAVPAWDATADHPLVAAGHLKSTAADMLAFLRGWLRGPDSPLGFAFDALETQFGVGKDGAHLSSGQTTGQHTSLFVDRKRQLGVVVLADTATIYVRNLCYAIAKALMSGMVEPVKLPQLAREPVGWEPEWLGDYEIPANPLYPPGAIMEIREADGSLTSIIRTESFRDIPRKLYAKSPARFFFKAQDSELAFEDGLLVLSMPMLAAPLFCRRRS